MIRILNLKFVFTFFFISVLAFGQGQLYSIKGTVIDSTTQRGIADVNIIVKGMKIGTVSQPNGFFTLTGTVPLDSISLSFSHIKYRSKTVPATYFSQNDKLLLVEKRIPLPGVEIAGTKPTFEYDQDITNLITRIKSESFELKGFTDAADLLHHDPSVYIQENLSGKKTVSVRGAAAEDITVLYNGVKINNNFNNLYDLSIIDPASLEQIDLIKGSSAAQFGTLNDMAVINLIPKKQQDYLFKFRQQIGTYDTGEWGLNFYENLGGLDILSSYTSGSNQRIYSTVSDVETQLYQENQNIFASLNYQIDRDLNNFPNHTLSLDYILSNRNFEHQNYQENFNTNHELKSLHYQIQYIQALLSKFSLSHQKYSEKHLYNFRNYDYNRTVQDNYLNIEAAQKLILDNVTVLIDYLHDQSRLSYANTSSYDPALDPDNSYERLRDGYGTNLQIKSDQDTNSFHLAKVNLSLNFEIIRDKTIFGYDIGKQNRWQQTSYMASIVCGSSNKLNDFNITLHYVSAYNIPTLYQQLSSQLYRHESDTTHELLKEYKRQAEIDLEFDNLQSKTPLNYHLNGALFYNHFDSKFHYIYVSGSPLRYFDNFSETSLAGFESNFDLYTFHKRISLGASYARYWFADRLAFSFKPDQKLNLTFNYITQYFNTEIVWFTESERYGNLYYQGEVIAISLPKFSNVDLHIKYSFPIWRTRMTLSLSGRNLLSRAKTLEGIAVRDRRIYLSGAIEFK